MFPAGLVGHFNPLKIFKFCPFGFSPKLLAQNFSQCSHAAAVLVGHELSRAKPDSPSQQAGCQKKQFSKKESANISILRQKNMSTSIFHLGLVQAAPLPTLVGWVACCQLDLHAGVGTSQGDPQGPAPLAGASSGPSDHHLRALI